MVFWDGAISDRDKEVYAAAGYGGRMGLGSRPALLIIDVSYNFTGERPEPILEAVKTYRNSCGLAAWDAIEATKPLLATARAKGTPVFYSTGRKRSAAIHLGRWGNKNARSQEDMTPHGQKGTEIVAEIGPQPGEVVIEKEKPSVFFGTGFLSYLIDLQIDTLLVTGTTTSGCVRATVVDAFSYNFRVGVVGDATFDRGEVSHKVNLFDMHSKYAEVISSAEAMTYLNKVGSV